MVGRAYELNAEQDTRNAQICEDFAKVLHVSHMEWDGIRAAASYLPGQKLTISAEIEPTPELVEQIGSEISRSGVDKIVFHGFSPLMEALVYYLTDWGYRTFIVFHGGSARWHDDFERRLAFACLRLAGEGRIRRLHILRRGFDYPVDRLFKPMLFNISPRISLAEPRDRRKDLVAFVPGVKSWTKNVVTNIFGAALCEAVGSVVTYADISEYPYPVNGKISRIEFLEKEKLTSYARADIALNVSTVDNHPMTNIEAQAMGVPCLRSPLFLDALEHHPYVSLTTVSDAGSVRDIGEAIIRVAAVPPDEMRDIVLDYQAQSDRVSLERYQEFLEV